MSPISGISVQILFILCCCCCLFSGSADAQAFTLARIGRGLMKNKQVMESFNDLRQKCSKSLTTKTACGYILYKVTPDSIRDKVQSPISSGREAAKASAQAELAKARLEEEQRKQAAAASFWDSWSGMGQKALGVGLMAVGASLRQNNVVAGLEVVEDATTDEKARKGLLFGEFAYFMYQGDVEHMARAGTKLMGGSNEEAAAAQLMVKRFTKMGDDAIELANTYKDKMMAIVGADGDDAAIPKISHPSVSSANPYPVIGKPDAFPRGFQNLVSTIPQAEGVWAALTEFDQDEVKRNPYIVHKTSNFNAAEWVHNLGESPKTLNDTKLFWTDLSKKYFL